MLLRSALWCHGEYVQFWTREDQRNGWFAYSHGAHGASRMMRLSRAAHCLARLAAFRVPSALSIAASTSGFAYSAMLLLAAFMIDLLWKSGRKNDRAPSPG